MCFTPKVSLATAIFEFLVSGFIYLRYQKSFFPRFVALFLFILGFYQFTEFMMCSSGNINLWGKMGFITYTFLPAVGLHLILTYSHKNFISKIRNKVIIYLPMVIFMSIAILDQNFIISGSCSRFFVSIKNYFQSGQNLLVQYSYFAYYFGYIAMICADLAFSLIKEKNKNKLLVYLVILATTLLAILPPLVLLFVFPAFSYQFPSVYCQFAILYAVFAILGVYWDEKKVGSKKLK